MTAASKPPAELPVPGAGCEGDNSQQLAALRSQRTAKEPYRGCEGRALGARATAMLLNQGPSASPVVTSDDAVAPVECAYVAVQRHARPNAWVWPYYFCGWIQIRARQIDR
jgi:hypothetical protein